MALGGIRAWAGEDGDGTVDCKTIGGNAKALSGYPTTHQILVAEEVYRQDRTIDRRYNRIFLKKAIVRPYRRHSLVFCLPTTTSLAVYYSPTYRPIHQGYYLARA